MTDLLEPYVDTSVDDLPPLETTDDRTTDNRRIKQQMSFCLCHHRSSTYHHQMFHDRPQGQRRHKRQSPDQTNHADQ